MLTVGQRVGELEIEAALGSGGMATVYRARHPILGTLHALKVLDPRYRALPEARQRFLDEARIQAKHLSHPNIVRVTGLVSTPDVAALIMDLVDGPSLDDHLSARGGRPLPTAEIRVLFAPILDAIGYAHAQGIVHRDLKPANILLARTAGGLQPKVTDFGIAKVTDDAAVMIGKKHTTKAEAHLGTLGYMSPEQIRRAKSVTPAADIFALGAMLYELATGTAAFAGDSEFDVMEKIVRGTYTPPEQLNPDIDPALSEAVRRALDPDPTRRPASCSELAQLTRASVGAPGTPAASGAPRKNSRAGVVAIVASLLALAGAAGLYARKRGGQALPASIDAAVTTATTSDSGSVQRNQWITIQPPATPVLLGVSVDELPDSVSGFRPSRAITAPPTSYQIQQHEVTWAEIEPWLVQNPEFAFAPPAWASTETHERKDLPVTGVPWESAHAYCQSLGARLPTEEQWEYAARGPDRRPFSWGAGRIDLFRTNAFQGPDGKLKPVMTSDQDRTPGEAAIFDLMGNAQEWTLDLWREDVGGEDESWVQGDNSYRAVRGLPIVEAAPRQVADDGAARRVALCAAGECVARTAEARVFVGFRCVR